MDSATSRLADLRRIIRSVRSASFFRSYSQLDWGNWHHEPCLTKNRHSHQDLQELADAVEELTSILPDVAIDASVIREFAEDDWCLATELEVLAPRKILRGFLLPVREIPVQVPVTLKLYAFIKINGTKDILDRHLHQGIHYHYALASKKHTTTMICWDTRWASALENEKKIRGIFHELHGEGSKFASARPGRWCDEKRESIRDACVPDLMKWPIEEFRCASNGSLPIWPRNSELTPRICNSPGSAEP